MFAANGTIRTVTPPLDRSINAWWDDMFGRLPKEKSWEASGTIIYAMWGIWKERNRRVFRNVGLLPTEVVALVREEIAQRAYAHSLDPGDLLSGV